MIVASRVDKFAITQPALQPFKTFFCDYTQCFIISGPVLPTGAESDECQSINLVFIEIHM